MYGRFMQIFYTRNEDNVKILRYEMLIHTVNKMVIKLLLLLQLF